LYLGNTQLSLDTLNNYHQELKTWFDPPCPTYQGGQGGSRGDLLLYGCNVAAGDAGEEFITKLHKITGAEIAASTTRIGNVYKGGNWELDYLTSKLTPQLAFNVTTQQNYAGVLEEEDKNPIISDLAEELSQNLAEYLATVTTDLDDYLPGATAIITGENFEPGETIELQVLHTDGIPNTGGGHDPWQVTDGGAGDLDGVVDGDFETTWYVNPDDSANSAFEVTATGLNSGEIASNTFTDSPFTIFADNFDGIPTGRWTVNPNGTDGANTAARGQWIVGDPVADGTTQLANTFSGSNALITGIATNQDVDNGTTTVRSPNFTLPSIAGSINLSFQYTYGATVAQSSDTFIARLRKASDNSILTSPVSLTGNSTAAWTLSGSNSLNSYAGQQVYLEFVATDSSTDNAVEAGIDDVSVTFTPTTTNKVFGTVFNDYNNDGIQQITNSASETGVSGITVNYVRSDGTSGSTTTDTNGLYSIDTNNLAVRVNFSGLPTGYFDSKVASSSNGVSQVFFKDAAGGEANLGLLDPDRYTTTSTPTLITSCFQLGAYSGSSATALVSVLHTANTVPTGTTTLPLTNSGKYADATIGEVGSVYGLAYHKETGDLFAGAFQKRFSDVGVDGNGAIYRIANLDDTLTGNDNVTTFIDLDDFIAGSNSAGAYSHNTNNTWNVDSPAFSQVGKVALGDVDISEDRKYIWTINLADRKLYKIQVGSSSDSTTPVDYTAGDTRTINSYDIVSGVSSSLVSGTNTADLRPFALAEKDGLIYVGMVNSAQTTQNANDLRAYVYTFNPTTGTFSSSSVLEFALNYTRQNKIDFPDPKQAATWDPWTDTHGGTSGTDGLQFDQEGTGAKYWALRTQPIFSDIEFDNNGNMIVGFRDRTGDQIGDQSLDLSGSGNYNTGTGGDILRATVSGNQWTIETGATDTDANTEFYRQDDYNSGTADQYDHNETAQGGLTQIPGYSSIETTALDPVNLNSGGINGLNNTTGLKTRGIQLYTGGNFNKANGLGDLESFGELAPIEIGNRIWSDTDSDGIQDAGESGIASVTVNLYNSSGTLVGTTATNSSGEYYFNNSNVNLNGASGLLPNTTYSIRLDTANNYISGQPLNGKNVTLSNQGSNDQLDSDAVISSGFPRITLTTGDYGENNHSYDFGFSTTPRDYGDAPDGTSGNGAGDYTTTSANSGASHTIVNNLSIGSTLDTDDGTSQNTAADDDDTKGSDDEDGVTFSSILKTDNSNYSVSVNVFNNIASTTAYLVGWIDFNQDGLFQATEAASTSLSSNASLQSTTLNWNTIPSNIKAGTTYARFRLSTDAALTISTPNGSVTNGEVEDYQLTVTGVDYGDAPDTSAGTGAGNYTTTKANSGASHTIVSGLSIGSSVDGDSGTLQNTAATLDDTNGSDDEDGVTFGTKLLQTNSSTYSVNVNVNNTLGTNATLVGWIDFDHSGTFDADEAVSATVTSGGSSTQTLTWSGGTTPIPGDILGGTTYARFRLSTDASLNTIENSDSVGNLPDGEVEDYQICIANIYGTRSSDNLTASATSGDDVIFGDEGQDTLSGGAGDDKYFYSKTSEGVDIITDFDTNGDALDFRGIVANELGNVSNPFSNGYVKAVSFGSHTMIQVDFDAVGSLNPKDVVLLQGVDSTNINASDFIFS
jgi:hypothetical protein